MSCLFQHCETTFFLLLEFYNIYVMIIYIDILFFENVVLDFIIILATGIICNSKINFWRMLFGSIIGSACTTISMIFNFDKILIKLVLSVLIILIVFGYKSKKRFIKYLGVFYLTTITFGGASFLLLFSINPEKIVYSMGHFLGLYPVKIAIIRRNSWIFLNCICSKNVKKKIRKNLQYRNIL